RENGRRGPPAAPPRPLRIRRSPRDRGCHARTAAPRSRSSRPLPSIDRSRGAADSGPMHLSIIPPDPHDPLLLLLVGLAIDAVFGEMPAVFAYVPHPVALAGRVIAFFEATLNRTQRSERRRRGRGIP